jgi:hypothetical protein
MTATKPARPGSYGPFPERIGNDLQPPPPAMVINLIILGDDHLDHLAGAPGTRDLWS